MNSLRWLSKASETCVPADGRAEFVQAPRGVGGGGVVKFGQAVHPLQDHLQHVADLPQHAAWLHAPHYWVKEKTWQRRQAMMNELPECGAGNRLVEQHAHSSRCQQPCAPQHSVAHVDSVPLLLDNWLCELHPLTPKSSIPCHIESHAIHTDSIVRRPCYIEMHSNANVNLRTCSS